MSIGGAPSASAAPGDHLFIVMGDSISFGLNSSSIADSFAGRLYADFRASRGADALDNRAYPGATAASGRRNQLTRTLADISAESDTVALTVGFGGNEALDGSCTGRWDGSCGFRRNLDYILSELTEALDTDPGSEFVAVLAYYNPRLGTPGEAFYDEVVLGANRSAGCKDTGADVGLNDVILQEAGDYGLPVANTFRPMKEAGTAAITADHIHPTDLGHAVIAQAFRDARPRCPATPDGGPGPKPNPKPTCKGVVATIVAAPGRPTTGTKHRDVIAGTSQRDRIRARGGNDLVCAREGNDEVSGGDGRDTLFGGPGRDHLLGGPGKNLLVQ
jgi:lysophospholipase L1-like esterase